MRILKLALPNHDVHSSSLKDQVLNSRYASPKIDTTANPPHAAIINLNWTDTTAFLWPTIKTAYSFPHGYNYIPAVIGVFSYKSDTLSEKGVLPFHASDQDYSIVIEADQTNINIKLSNADRIPPATAIKPFTIKIRYYVFAERGKLEFNTA